jgi:hypothetical protein
VKQSRRSSTCFGKLFLIDLEGVPKWVSELKLTPGPGRPDPRLIPAVISPA